MDSALPVIISGVISYLVAIGMAVGWILILVALWRGMKAHEAIARTLASISDSLKNMSSQ